MRVASAARRSHRRGTTFVETMVAMTGAVMIAGSFLGLISAMSQAYQARTAMSELSGYVDIAMFNLKRDIWKSVLAQSAACPTQGCPGGTALWLALQASPTGWGTGEDICYMLDSATAGNTKLVRWRWQGGAWQGQWVVAQRLVADPVVVDTEATITAGQGVQVRLQTSRTALGRSFSRNEPPVTYRFQRPCPAAGQCT